MENTQVQDIAKQLADQTAAKAKLRRKSWNKLLARDKRTAKAKAKFKATAIEFKQETKE